MQPLVSSTSTRVPVAEATASAVGIVGLRLPSGTYTVSASTLTTGFPSLAQPPPVTITAPSTVAAGLDVHTGIRLTRRKLAERSAPPTPVCSHSITDRSSWLGVNRRQLRVEQHRSSGEVGAARPFSSPRVFGIGAGPCQGRGPEFEPRLPLQSARFDRYRIRCGHAVTSLDRC